MKQREVLLNTRLPHEDLENKTTRLDLEAIDERYVRSGINPTREYKTKNEKILRR